MSQKITRFHKRRIKHAVGIGHLPAETDNFEVIGTEYHNTHKRQISEAVLVKKLKPSLNIQEKSVTMKRFN